MATINKPNVNIHVSISSVTIYIPPLRRAKTSDRHVYYPSCIFSNPINKGPENLSPTLMVPLAEILCNISIGINTFNDPSDACPNIDIICK